MPKFLVEGRIVVWLSVEVDAPDREAAEQEACQVGYLTGYAGNGALSGKLLGTDEKNVTLSAGDEFDIDSVAEIVE